MDLSTQRDSPYISYLPFIIQPANVFHFNTEKRHEDYINGLNIKLGCIQKLLRAAWHRNLADQHKARLLGTYRKVPAESTNNYFPMSLMLQIHTQKGKQM